MKLWISRNSFSDVSDVWKEEPTRHIDKLGVVEFFGAPDSLIDWLTQEACLGIFQTRPKTTECIAVEVVVVPLPGKEGSA